MNDSHDFPPKPGDDPLLEEMLSLLKRLDPPLETRLGNRRAVAGELGVLLAAKQKRLLPWWRRTISVPVPLAACLAVVAAIAAPSVFRGVQERPAQPSAAPDRPVRGGAGGTSKALTVAKQAPDAQPVMEYYQTEVYLCGVGRLYSESGYRIKEQSHD